MSQPSTHDFSYIEAYLHTFDQLHEAVAGLTEGQLRWKASPEAWSINEILTHLTDHNLVVSFRVREILAGSEVRLPGFDQVAWVKGQKANESSTEEILALFRQLLRYNAQLFRRLEPEDWNKTGVNAKGETVTLAKVVRSFIAHLQGHIGQIERNIRSLSERQTTVRHADPGDRNAIENVLLDAYGQYEQDLAGERWEQYKANILQALDAPTTKARLVAESNGEIVGSVFVYDSSESAYGAPQLGINSPIIRLLAVSRQARGLGIATDLIRESAKLALAWGAESLYLHTSDLMADAVRLYEKLGFERAIDKEFTNGDVLVKSYRLALKESALLHS